MTKYSSILIVEDQVSIRTLLAESVQEAGYMVYETGAVEMAISILKRETINAILLDLELEDGNGLEVLRFVRRQNDSIPILIISSHAGMDTRLTCFREGTDDYILKPFRMEEIIARVHRACQRHQKMISEPNSIRKNFQKGNLTLDYQTASVMVGTTVLPLRKRLFYMLEYFMKNEGVILNKRVLHAALWRDQGTFDENTLSVHIHQLRKIIDSPDSETSHIETIRGIGYRFSA